jgi:hypothetical protein
MEAQNGDSKYAMYRVMFVIDLCKTQQRSVKKQGKELVNKGPRRKRSTCVWSVVGQKSNIGPERQKMRPKRQKIETGPRCLRRELRGILVSRCQCMCDPALAMVCSIAFLLPEYSASRH